MTVLTGKGALVTGGSRGIGRAVVERLRQDGAEVVFCYERSEEAARRVAEETGATAVRADLGVREDLERLFAEAEARLPGVDILVNNAATTAGQKLLMDLTDDDFERSFAVNVRAVLLAMRWAARVMRDGGRIVTVSSINTLVPAPLLTLYCGGKGAVEQFAKVAARELGGRGITVNVVSSGATDTDMLRGANPPEALERTLAFTALGRLGQPDDIASVVAFLAGPDGRWVTGQNLIASGGLLV
ncbi:Cyclic-di-GMP-binding biofilm dispersal mediator protein [Nonomuraea coxensis DSM 45129]|uniref:Cyclic-di-GMP-binding biofilm dispersal mediator protein n=1 Tax=Nonomuraea coxensis DSM 45129 TaxID=1122611 RepID=A0ABX8U8F4_9ACTN|nr:SDR family oxidoreductase [Nonomuraea coxensis]QYC44003.1 Cyclic-di-GMP-binding biofilm dispersal mediator protein [Nonomuraea coxensis DSM 45129]